MLACILFLVQHCKLLGSSYIKKELNTKMNGNKGVEEE